MKKSMNCGTEWAHPDGNSNWNGTPMAVIGAVHTSADTLCAATGGMGPGSAGEPAVARGDLWERRVRIDTVGSGSRGSRGHGARLQAFGAALARTQKFTVVE